MKIRWTRRALADLKRITERIAKDKPAVAAEFVQSVSEKAGLLGEFPLLGRIGAYQDTRELVVHKNYIVTYRMRGDELEVLQVWHVARDIRRGGHR